MGDRKKLEQRIRKFWDCSKYTREEMEEELKDIIPYQSLKEMSDLELENEFRANFDFSEYSTEELKKILKFHKRYAELSREELEAEIEEMIEEDNSDYHGFWKLIALWSIICLIIGFLTCSALYTRELERRIDFLQERIEELYKNDIKANTNINDIGELVNRIVNIIFSDNYSNSEYVATPWLSQGAFPLKSI